MREFAERYLGLPYREDEDRWWDLPSDGPWWSARASKRHVSVPYVPLNITAGRDCVVRYLAEQGLDYGWARDIPGALMEGVRRFVVGEEPLLGAANGIHWEEVWSADLDEQVLELNAGEDPLAYVNSSGWLMWLTPTLVDSGSETGEEGRRLAEAAVRRRYWVTP